MSFRRFFGLSCDSDAEVVDETMICRFRNALIRAGLLEWLFERVKGGDKWVYDEDAGYTKNRKQVYYGYKVHGAMDKRGWVCGLKTRCASVHESKVCEEWLVEGVKELYRDSGYRSVSREE